MKNLIEMTCAETGDGVNTICQSFDVWETRTLTRRNPYGSFQMLGVGVKTSPTSRGFPGFLPEHRATLFLVQCPVGSRPSWRDNGAVSTIRGADSLAPPSGHCSGNKARADRVVLLARYRSSKTCAALLWKVLRLAEPERDHASPRYGATNKPRLRTEKENDCPLCARTVLSSYVHCLGPIGAGWGGTSTQRTAVFPFFAFLRRHKAWYPEPRNCRHADRSTFFVGDLSCFSSVLVSLLRLGCFGIKQQGGTP